MGSVFRATHLAMERKVAVKLLKPHLTSDQSQLDRFAREARSTMKVDSPHAVKVLDFGVTPHQDYYMVLEYLDGRTVQRELDVDGAFTPARVVHIARQALHGLGAAHRQGIVHRDIKPDNLLLLRVGADPDYTKVLDFGVAKLMEGAAGSTRSKLALTQQGMVFGTPELMSPEQACGQPLDGRSDLYSVAATMFAMLTARGLFEAGSAIEWLSHHVRTPAPSLASVLPTLAAYPELDAVLQRCLAKDRDARPATAEALESMLAALEPTLSRPGGSAPLVTSPSGRVKPAFSASSYVSAFGDPNAVTATGPSPTASAGTSAPARLSASHLLTDRLQPDDTIGAIVASQRRRGWLIAVGALAMVGVIIAIALVASTVLTRRATALGGSTLPSGKLVASTPTLRAPTSGDGRLAGDPAPPVAWDAGRDPAPADARPAVPVRPRAGPAGVDKRLTPVAKKSNPHLAAAVAAGAAGNRLRQLAEADLALRADPRSTRAKYLLGDALVQTGDLDRGCRYLRALKRDRRAAARAKAANCP